MVLTAACAVGSTLVLWVLLVMVLDRRFRGFDNIVWSGTLWLSALLCTGVVSYSRRATRPVFACTSAFAVFGLAYIACEGPIFGVVTEGGDPAMTQFVVWNLSFLPLGVFVAAEIGRWLGSRRRGKTTDERRDTTEQPKPTRINTTCRTSARS
jgi:hypothetical protein